MNKLVILHSINHFKKYSDVNKNFQEETTQILALTIRLRIFLQIKEIGYKNQEDYITETQSIEMDEAAFEFSKNWHNNYFKYHGISLGLLLQWDLNYYFSRIIRNIQTILNIIEIEKPSQIISFKDDDPFISEFNDALKHICLIKKIEFNLISTMELVKLDLFKPPQLYGEKLISFLDPILKSRVFTYFARKGLNFLWALKKVKMKRFQEDKQQNLSIDYLYHQSVINDFSKTENLILLDNKIDFRRYKDLLQNFKNLFLNKPDGYHIFLNNFNSIVIRRKVKLDFIECYENWLDIIKDPDFIKRFTYKDISIWPIIKTKIYKIISSDFKRIIRNILIIERILNNTHFRTIILSNDVTERAMTLVHIAAKMKIPTLVIQHGLTGHFTGFVPSFSIKFATWGKISKEHLVKYGMEEDKIIITGSPRFDYYISLNRDEKLKEKIKKSVYENFGIGKDKKLIVSIANHWNYYRRFTSIALNLSEIEKYFSTILNSAKNIPNSHFIIKLHPSDPTGGSDGFIMKKLIGAKNVSIIQNYDIRNLLVACDCAIAGESTTVLELMLLKKPIICFNFKERDFNTPYFEYKIAPKVSNYEDLLDQLQKALNEGALIKDYENFLKDYLYKIDGLSTKRTIQVIKELLNNS